MKTLQIKRRIENAVNAFFDETRSNESKLTTFKRCYVSLQETESAAAAKRNAARRMLKQMVVFFPSAFYLFFGTIALFMYGSIASSRLIILSGLVGSFVMMVFGIGNLRNSKHFLMPFSIVALATATFFAFSLSGIPAHVWSQKYAPYLFPMALIAPFLAKGWIDARSRAENL